MSFSIKNIRNASAFMTLRHPSTNEDLIDPTTNTAVELELVGAESREFNERVVSLRKDKKADVSDYASVQDLYLDGVCAAVVGWNASAAECFKEELDGEGTYSAEKARKLLGEPGYFWICKQIDKFLQDRASFFTKA